MSRRSSRSSERRRGAITASIARSISARPARVKPTGSSRRTFISSAIWAIGLVEALTRLLITLRSRCSGVPGAGLPSMPKIPAMITSRVIACIRDAIEKGAPSGQLSISFSVASAIVSA